MREVAAVAGVSLSTVSRTLNDDPKVAPELAEKVRAAVTMLDYRRDARRPTLRRADRLSASIGLVFDDVANPFHATLHRGIEDVARAHGVLAFAGSSDEDAERERDLVQAFLSRRVDGLVIVPAGRDHGYLLRDRDAGVALVFVDRPPRLHRGRLRDVRPRRRRARGHRAPARRRAPPHRLPRRPAPDPERGRAPARLQRGARRRGRPVRPALVRMELEDSATARRATEELFSGENPPTAVFAAQNLITIGAVAALRALGRRHDVALVGFDDLTLADAVEPGLTVVAQDANGIGRAAAELLFARLDGENGPARTVDPPDDPHPPRLGRDRPGGRHDSASLLGRRLRRPLAGALAMSPTAA